MAEMWNFFTRAIERIPEYPLWIFGVVVVIVLGLTQLAKIPIKHFTNKIENENLRKKVNMLIMLLPIAFGFLASWILTYFGFTFSTIAALVWGSSSQVIYEFISRLFRRIKNGEDITTETISEDAKESIEIVETAEDKFNDLVNQIKNGK